jgi:hypothetical protein
LDNLLEQAYAYLGQPHYVVAAEEQLAGVGGHVGALILKLHGGVESGTRVLTLSEYDRFQNSSSTMRATMVSLLSQFHVLILGSGLDDQNFRRLYGESLSATRHIGREIYYVSSGLPEFVKAAWSHRRMEFIDIKHADFSDWVLGLHRTVSSTQPTLSTGLRESLFASAKESAMQEIALSKNFGQGHQRYLEKLHAHDYGWFAGSWDRTLYGPLRARVWAVLQQMRTSENMTLAYVGPGPHAPLFASDSLGKLIWQEIGKVVLFDIADGVLSSARDALERLKPNDPPTIVETVQHDVTGPLGEEFHKGWRRVLEEKQPDKMIAELEKCLDKWYSMSTDPQLPRNYAEACSKLRWAPYDLVYSEMVGSFTGTPSLMGFVVELARKLDMASDDFKKVMAVARSVWQAYNLAILECHFVSLRDSVKEGGLVVVAVDVEKRFHDPTFPPIFSLPAGSSVRLPADLKGFGPEAEPIVWLDHDSWTAYAAKGLLAEDFRPHAHKVEMVVRQRTDGRQYTGLSGSWSPRSS